MTFREHLDTLLSPLINYELGSWERDLVFPYWVGEYQETDFQHEQGYSEYAFTLTGTTKGTYTQLEEDKQKIKALFSHYRYSEEGYSVAIFYDTAFMIPSEDEQIRRMEIHLTIKEWSE